MKQPAAHLTQPTELVWMRLNRVQRSVFDRVEAVLKAAGLPPLDWYDVLLELWRAEGRRLRQVDLERRILFRQYNVSRLVDRLEAAGLVRRERCSDDARASWIVPTNAGLELRARTWPHYAAAVAEHVGAKLTEEEATKLAELLARLK